MPAPRAAGEKNVDGRDVGAKQSFVACPGHDGEGRPVPPSDLLMSAPCACHLCCYLPQLTRHGRACPGHPRSPLSCMRGTAGYMMTSGIFVPRLTNDPVRRVYAHGTESS